MGKINTAPDTLDALFARIAALESTIRTLATARRIGDTSIDGGKLTIRGGALVAEDVDGSPLMYVGQGSVAGVAGSEQAFMQLSRSSGRPFFVMTGASADKQYWLWYDESGTAILGDDIVSGQGLARPYLPYSIVATRDIATPPESTTNAAFGPLWTTAGLKQHPRVRALVYVTTDAGTTGEVRLVDPTSGLVLAGPVPTGSSPYLWLEGDLPGAHMSLFKIDVEARRVAGAGTVRTLLLACYGVQSL